MVENAEKIPSDLATLSARVLLDLAEKPAKLVKNLRLFLVIENHYVYITARPTAERISDSYQNAEGPEK